MQLTNFAILGISLLSLHQSQYDMILSCGGRRVLPVPRTSRRVLSRKKSRRKSTPEFSDLLVSCTSAIPAWTKTKTTFAFCIFLRYYPLSLWSVVLWPLRGCASRVCTLEAAAAAARRACEGCASCRYGSTAGTDGSGRVGRGAPQGKSTGIYRFIYIYII